MYQRKAKKQMLPKPLPAPPKSCEKYRRVSAVVDTGPNLRKRQAALDAIKQYYHVRPDELFGRIRVSTLVTLLVEVAQLQQEVDTPTRSPESLAPHASAQEKRADLQSLVEGTGELSLSSGDAPPPPPPPPAPPAVADQPCLLLDVRDWADFEREHIVTARHYPASRLSRTVNYETAEMWRYKRATDALVVLCDEDELTAQRCATTLAQRGYDNVFILSGGLKVARKKFPRGLLTSTGQDQLTASDIETLSTALDTVYNSVGRSGGAVSARSLCSSGPPRSSRSAAASSTAGGPPRWRI